MATFDAAGLRGGGKTLKLFDVAVKKAETAAAATSVDDLL